MKSLFKTGGVWGMIIGCSLLMACNGHPGDPGPGLNLSSGYALSKSDATAVQTSIKKKPANPSKSNKAGFTFACNSGTCAYKCSLDSGSWKACTSPKSYSKLSEGAHNFQVKASSSGKSDRTPALYSWVVDARLDVQGILDNTTIIIGQATLLDRIETRLASLFLKSAQAGTSTAVDTILAASPNGIYYAVLDGSTFNLAVPRGAIYVVAFYKGMDLKGILTLDTTTDLNSIPALEGSSDFSLGTVSLDSGTGVVTATISQADAFAALGLDTDLATSIGIYDGELQSKTSVDVDGNGIMDDQEGKTITLGIKYIFHGAESFSALNNWSNQTLVSFNGYSLNFDIFPNRPDLAWGSAILISPQDINFGNSEPDCWSGVGNNGKGHGLGFYCDCGVACGMATTPMPPPKGTYIVRVGAQDFTFNNVDSIAIDPALNEVYVPSVKLTFSSGKVTRLQWQFWKRISGIWYQATDSEIQAIIDNTSCGLQDQSRSNEVMKDLQGPPTASGSVSMPAQDFVPRSLWFNYNTIAGYQYGFEW